MPPIVNSSMNIRSSYYRHIISLLTAVFIACQGPRCQVNWLLFAYRQLLATAARTLRTAELQLSGSVWPFG